MLQNKKSSILLVLKVLHEFTDEEHYLTQMEIASIISRQYGIELERKSIGSSLNLLEELDYDIVRGSKGGFALLSRTFDLAEVRFINDAIFSSKAITGKQAINLSQKVNSCLSKYQRKNYSYIYKSDELIRTTNHDIFYNIELIEDAIKANKRISFKYLTYDKNGNPCVRRNGYRYIVSPYFLINNFGRYYLLCNYREKYRPLQTFRIDYMIETKIEEEWTIKPLNTLNGIENFDISKYLNEHIYLFANEVVDALILIEKSWAIQYINDWFGKKAKIFEKDGKLYAKVKCDETALFYWINQYGDEFKLLEPKSLIDKFINHLTSQIEKYKK